MTGAILLIGLFMLKYTGISGGILKVPSGNQGDIRYMAKDKKSENIAVLPEGRTLPVEIEHEMKKSFIDYSMSVIVDRALPDVRDGLKPVHRRILYSMLEQGFTPEKQYRKCSTTVGYCMGHFHPHGDAAIYESLVRLAQDFSMRHPLVDGNGNFGSRDGDPPAAQRYTEAKMTKISMEMLADINKDTVDFRPNYDEHDTEPCVLPSRFPNLLVNGSMGIAVGMATNIPPHNLGEVIDGIVAMVDKPEITCDELMNYIKGPDFPTAANILGVGGIREAYIKGRGKIAVRAEAAVEDMPGGRQRIVITELPYGVNNKDLVKRIADLYKEKKIEGISDLRDEYSKEGIRIVIELKRDCDANVLLNKLYKYSDLQANFGVNMTVIVPGENGAYQPKLVNLKEALSYYINHQRDVLTRRTKFDLAKAEDRAHILEGILTALDNIDEVISIIRASKTEPDAKEALMARFGFTERQSQYIVDMRLGRLTGIEREKVLQEYEEKKLEIAGYKELLADPVKMDNLFKEEITEIKRKYADERRTKIIDWEDDSIDLEDLIEEHETAVTLTHCGYIKRTPAESYRAQNRGGKGVIGQKTREEDFVEHILITSSHSTLLFLTNRGRMYSLRGYEIPDAAKAAKGSGIMNLLQLEQDEKVEAVIPIRTFTDAKYLIIATKKGIIKKTELEAYKNIRKAGLIAVDLRDDDELVNACVADEDCNIIIVSKDAMAIRFDEKDVRATGRSSMGVKGMTLREGDFVIGMGICAPGKTLLTITEKGFGKRTDLAEYKEQSRGGVGVKTYNLTDKTGRLSGMIITDDSEDIMLITTDGSVIRMHVKDINCIGRVTSGVILMRLDEGDMIVSCASTAYIPEENESEEGAADDADNEGKMTDEGAEGASDGIAEETPEAGTDAESEETDRNE